MPLEEMTEREHEYFQRKDRACDEFRERESYAAAGTDTTLVLGSVIGIAAAFLVFAFN